jgi:hypothetical protein
MKVYSGLLYNSKKLNFGKYFGRNFIIIVTEILISWNDNPVCGLKRNPQLLNCSNNTKPTLKYRRYTSLGKAV